MKILFCGDRYTLGEGLADKKQAYPYLVAEHFDIDCINLSQSGASEFLITEQVEKAITLSPNIVIIGHTSEYRWQVRDKRTGFWQGFIVANWIERNKRKTPEHYAAWHAAGMLYYSEESVVRRLWKSAVALQSSIITCNQIHINMFNHLQNDLEQVTNNFINFPLDSLKHKEMAPDGSHAGPSLHKELANLLVDHINKTH